MKKMVGAIMGLIALILSGCGMFMSEDDALKKTKEVSETAFSEEDVKSNTDALGFTLYLPDSMEISDESKSNLIIAEGDQTFILFYNSMEERTSKLNYESASKVEDNILLEAFEDDDRFGYVRILPINEQDKYELQVGVGGVKITTYTEKSDLPDDAEKMMKIANSIAYTE
ncbi:hypothetical protein [Thalassobacillus hwangdonensis]|uniref:DUF4367 domain-containing protein n=1 Tax=Thalassobacillus hwangdonensis TaxID=546108 RepID=A0ABW3L0P0_9BACI